MRLGVSGRGGPTNPDPLRHVWTGRWASRTGRCRLSLCGRQIRPTPRDDLGSWDPEHPRACRACVTAIAEQHAELRATAARIGPR